MRISTFSIFSIADKTSTAEFESPFTVRIYLSPPIPFSRSPISPDATILPFDAVAQEDDGRYYIYRILDGWATKEYIDVIFEEEKGFVVSKDKDYSNICENPDLFTEKKVRVNNGND